MSQVCQGAAGAVRVTMALPEQGTGRRHSREVGGQVNHCALTLDWLNRTSARNSLQPLEMNDFGRPPSPLRSCQGRQKWLVLTTIATRPPKPSQHYSVLQQPSASMDHQRP